MCPMNSNEAASWELWIL